MAESAPSALSAKVYVGDESTRYISRKAEYVEHHVSGLVIVYMQVQQGSRSCCSHYQAMSLLEQ
jgi:hypothetical protein